ncbi:MAG: hypothetical protein JF590_02510, partial [Gemmatimonadetes bacterium]|nr:hypothetical protein [Gemmatimonadota bacterium]
PGQTGALTYSGVLFAPIPSLSLSLPSSTTVAATAAVADLGTDDFLVDSSTVFHVSAPTVVGTSTGFFDAPSFTGADNQQDGGIAKEQDYILSFANAGVYHITLNWTNGADVDLFLTNFAFSADLGHSFLGAGIPEAIDFTATAGQRIVLSINMFAGTIPTSLRVQVRRTS